MQYFVKFHLNYNVVLYLDFDEVDKVWKSTLKELKLKYMILYNLS